MKLKNIKCLLAVCLCASALLVGCGQKTADKSETSSESAQNQSEDIQEASRDVFAMDTYMTVTAYGENEEAAVDAAQAEIERLDALLSTGDADSEIAKLNADGSAELSEDAGYLTERALELYQKTDGAFDIAIYPVMEAWGFPTQNFQVPSQETLDQLLPLTDAGNISYDKETKKISFGVEGMKIDLGGIAKGYTGQKLAELFQEYGVSSALVSLGGNIQAIGTKPDGSSWKVGIRDPKGGQQDYIGVLSVENQAVVTSGGYERYFEEDGETYTHIINPRTGYPADGDLLSVTIVSKDGTLADGMSTALYIMGYEKACQFWRQHREEFNVILVTDDGKIHISENLKGNFQTEWELEMIESGSE